jgi:hypothetical protein
MKKFLAILLASAVVSSSACTSIESTKVTAETIASNGEAVAVVQATAVGLSLILHFITITEASLDTTVNKLLVTEAKALGGNKLQLLNANEEPKKGIFCLTGSVIGFPFSVASAVVVK